MSDGEALRRELKAGDQIIATDIAFFRHAPDKQSQHIGDLLMVNNPRIGDAVGGVSLNNRPGESSRIGLGSSLVVGKFRRATPDDPGYLATREQWFAIKNLEIEKLQARLWAKGVDFWAVLSVAVLLAVCLVTKGGVQ